MIEWDDLKQRIGFKKFPEDYLTGVKWEKYMELPKGSTDVCEIFGSTDITCLSFSRLHSRGYGTLMFVSRRHI